MKSMDSFGNKKDAPISTSKALGDRRRGRFGRAALGALALIPAIGAMPDNAVAGSPEGTIERGVRMKNSQVESDKGFTAVDGQKRNIPFTFKKNQDGTSFTTDSLSRVLDQYGVTFSASTATLKHKVSRQEYVLVGQDTSGVFTTEVEINKLTDGTIMFLGKNSDKTQFLVNVFPNGKITVSQ